MSTIIRAIKNSFEVARQREWNKTYWAFDIHGTILKPNYKYGDISKEFYPLAKECLQLISKREDICTILYTCSWPEEIQQYVDFFESNKINFDHVNSNPEVENKSYGCYTYKPYFNVLFEDKAGFDPEKDWDDVWTFMHKNTVMERRNTLLKKLWGYK